MRNDPLHSARRAFWTSLLLVTLLCRAYIPVGFMPRDGAPLLLQLCPQTAPLPHHHHADTHRHFENCPYGNAPATGPVSHLINFAVPTPGMAGCAIAAESQLRHAFLLSAHRPRGPPTLV